MTNITFWEIRLHLRVFWLFFLIFLRASDILILTILEWMVKYMDFNCIFHLTAYLKDKPDILVKEALGILCSTGRTVEQAADTLTGIFSVGGGEELDRYLPYLEPYRDGREIVTVRNGCLGIIDELGAAGVSVSCCDCKYIPMRKKKHISVADDILLLRCCVLDSTFRTLRSSKKVYKLYVPLKNVLVDV